MKIWLLDHGATWAERFGDFIASPFMRLSRWLADAWIKETRL